MVTKLEDLAEPFYRGAARGLLLIPQCRACSRHFFYPTVLCPHCHHQGHDWVQASGRAKLYSYTSVYRSPDPEASTPYVVAVVELDEGVRMMTNIVESDEADLIIGMPVAVRFGQNSEGLQIPFFAPVGKV